jgi:hypothetical protein
MLKIYWKKSDIKIQDDQLPLFFTICKAKEAPS